MFCNLYLVRGVRKASELAGTPCRQIAIKTRSKLASGFLVVVTLIMSEIAAQADNLNVQGNNSPMTLPGGNYNYDSVTISPEGSSGQGTLNIVDGVTITTTTLYNGDGDGGTVNQSGGSVTVTGTETGNGDRNRLNLGGWNAPYQKFYTLSGGVLTATAGVASLGSDDCGTLVINGGTANLLGLRSSWRNKGALTLTSGMLNLGAYGFVPDPVSQGHPDWTGFINLGGGTVRATANWSSALPMTLTGTGGDVTFDPNGNNITLSGNLSSTGTGGLIVNATGGAGALILSGTNTYSGDTMVQAGTLRIDNACLADASNVKLDISGMGGNVNLITGAVDTINALYINGVQQAAGLWGAVGSGVAHTSPFITGNGELLVSVGPAATTINGVWVLAQSGNWSDGSKWTTNPAFPHSAGDTAVISVSTANSVTVTLDASQTISTLVLGNSGDTTTGYTLSGTGANTLTLDNSTSAATITVENGTHVIEATVDLTHGLVISGSGKLTFSSSISGIGPLTMSGTGGTLVLSGTSLYTGGTVVTAGTVIQINSSALPENQSLTIGAGAKLVYDPNGFDAGPMILSSPLAAGPMVMNSPINPVPEPSTLALLVAGLVVGFGAWKRRKLELKI